MKTNTLNPESKEKQITEHPEKAPALKGKTKGQLVWEMFLYFFRISWYTFGGGWSIVAQIQRDYVIRKKYISNEDLLDIVSVGKSLPGIMIGNITFMFGYHICGIAGAFAAVIGMSLPCIAVLSAVVYFYEEFRTNVYVARALVGVRAAVVPIMFTATLKLYPAALKDWFTYVILIAAVALLVFTDFSAILIIVFAALIGIGASLLKERYGKKGEGSLPEQMKDHGAAEEKEGRK